MFIIEEIWPVWNLFKVHSMKNIYLFIYLQMDFEIFSLKCNMTLWKYFASISSKNKFNYKICDTKFIMKVRKSHFQLIF